MVNLWCDSANLGLREAVWDRCRAAEFGVCGAQRFEFGVSSSSSVKQKTAVFCIRSLPHMCMQQIGTSIG